MIIDRLKEGNEDDIAKVVAQLRAEKHVTTSGSQPAASTDIGQESTRHSPATSNVRGDTHRREALCQTERNDQQLRERESMHGEIFNLLKTLPTPQAQEVLQQIRSGTDAAALLQHYKTGSLLVEMAVSPESGFRYEFPYRSGMPQYLLQNNPYLDTLIYESTRPLQNPEFELAQHNRYRIQDIPSSEEHQNQFLKPFHAAQVMDPWLSRIKISSWTTVSDNEMLMQELLRAFLLCEYQFSAAFHKDLFLEDMASGRKEFCSSLLVNIVLAYSCVWPTSFLFCLAYL